MKTKDRKATISEVVFDRGSRAALVTAGVDADCTRLLSELGLAPTIGRSVLVVFGGADGLSGKSHQAAAMVGPGVVRAARKVGAAIVDGGTAAGVMSILGDAVAKLEDDRPVLLGVAPAELVAYPGMDSDGERVPLEPNHSHFVLTPGSEWGAETTLLLRLAEALAGDAPVIGVLIGGGEVSKAETLEAVRRGWPLFVVEQTGGVADDIADRRRKLQSGEGGRLRRVLPKLGDRARAERQAEPSIEEIAAADSIHIFDGEDAAGFARSLTWELQDKRILKHAWQTFAGYDALANEARRTFSRFQAWTLLLAIGATFTALLRDALDVGDWPGNLMHWAVVAAPILVSLLIALTWRFGFGKRWVLLRGAAEVIKSEIYRYRTGTGVYGETELAKMALSREEVLATRLNSVNEKLMQTEASSWPLRPYDGPLPPKMYGASAEDDGVSSIDADGYLALRVGVQLNYYHPKIASLARQLRTLQVTALAAGAAGTLLAAAGFEVWIALTTAIAAAAVAYISHLQVEPTLVAYNQAANKLESLRRVWEAQSPARRDLEQLVREAEGVLATELSGWVQQMNEAIEEAAKKAESRTSESAAPRWTQGA